MKALLACIVAVSAVLAPSAASAAPLPVLASIDATASVDEPAEALAWRPCEGPKGAQCAEIQVSGRDTGDWTIPVMRLPATGKRIGVLFTNPGGPGISGVGYLRNWGDTLARLRVSYDVVSFDPPGMGGSVPAATCLSEAQKAAIRDQPSAPRGRAERQKAYQLARLIGDACESLLGAALANVSTVNAAAVMDAIRAALGERRISYLGFSYGTLLGTVYAERYPDRTWRFVLDGAMDPALDYDRVRRDQAVALDKATRRFSKDCPQHRNCPLTGDPAQDMRTLADFVDALDEKPYRHNGKELSGLRALNLIQSSMYYPPYGWRVLRGVLGPALMDGNLKPFLRKAYSPDNMVNPADPEYLSVVCEDLATTRDPSVIPRKARHWAELAPLNGASRAWSTAPCATWPTRQPALPAQLDAAGSGPILVIGTTYDPATPVKWAKGLSAMLDNSYYLEWQGDGHLAYDGDRGGPCVTRVVDTFLLKGVRPAQETICRAV